MHQTVPIARKTVARPLGYGTWVRDASATEADALGLEIAPPDYAFALPDERELFEKWNTSKDEVAVIEPRYSQPVYACLLVMAALVLRRLRVAWGLRR